jgi:hypothetical protein
VDEMPPDSIRLVEHRQAGQLFTKNLKLSTPTIDDYGINIPFKLSTQATFNFKCPGCSRYIDLEYPRNFKIVGESLIDKRLKESYFFCHHCDKKLPFEDKPNFMRHEAFGGNACFVHHYPDREKAGWAISQMYSMSRSGMEYNFAKIALEAELRPEYRQEFNNSSLGRTFVAADAKISHEQVLSCISSHEIGNTPPIGFRSMGVDVGAVNHVVIYEWVKDPTGILGLTINDAYMPIVIYAGTTDGSVDDFEQVINLFKQFHCNYGVIDAEPERRESLRICQRLVGRMNHCDYVFSQQGRQVILSEEELSVKVNRTSWLDLALMRYKRKNILLPKDISVEFMSHICEPTRILKRDQNGHLYGQYINTSPDHFAHASVYAEIAFTLGASHGDNFSIVRM